MKNVVRTLESKTFNHLRQGNNFISKKQGILYQNTRFRYRSFYPHLYIMRVKNSIRIWLKCMMN